MYRHSLVRPYSCKSICFHLSFFVVFLLLGSLPALAQSVQVSGTIKDPDQSVVGNAVVSLENLQTARSFQATTNESGQYTFLSVPQGTYRLEAHKPGFAAIVLPSLMITAGQNITRDLSFALAGTSTSVTVNAGLTG